MLNTKEDLRKKLINIRKNIQPSMRRNFNDKIFKNVKLLIEKYKYNNYTVYIYISNFFEVDTINIINYLFEEDIDVAVPVVDIKTKTMSFKYITSFEELHLGYMNILEPNKNLPDATTLGIMIMPGVGFTKDKARLGYGGGYFDKYLSNASNINIKAALAYEKQIVESIETNEYDIKPDIIITEENIYE